MNTLHHSYDTWFLVPLHVPSGNRRVKYFLFLFCIFLPFTTLVHATNDPVRNGQSPDYKLIFDFSTNSYTGASMSLHSAWLYKSSGFLEGVEARNGLTWEVGFSFHPPVWK